ncbi:hypothetical protein LX36DRAFT_693319 [Colletotrichum falcatum]|nr:hypothetical protein LX36DRAFT_693319 [Colletotrichum falcatum]
MASNTLFLLCLKDMDQHGVWFDNLANVLVKVYWLHKVLQRAGHETDISTIEEINKFCRSCQLNLRAPGRFKFTLRDDYDFNYKVFVDVMYLDGNKLVLHVVDSATAFNAAKFLQSISAKHTWEALRMCWINVYLGPPDWIITDAGLNFHAAEFKRAARALSIEVKEIPIEAHNSIGKAVNNTAGPDGLVPTLLVFGVYPRISNNSPPSPSTLQRGEAVKKAMDEVRQLHAKRQVSEALATRNGPDTTTSAALPLQSLVRVWREKNGWQGPFTLLANDGTTCTVELPQGPRNFCITVVKLYHQEGQDANSTTIETTQAEDHVLVRPTPDEENPPAKETSDAIVVAAEQPPRRKRGRPRKNPVTTFAAEIATTESIVASAFTAKEDADYALAVELRKKGVITTPGKPFELSDKAEIEGLAARGVFFIVGYNEKEHGGIRIFKSRLVREVKGKNEKPYEKSRLVI